MKTTWLVIGVTATALGCSAAHETDEGDGSGGGARMGDGDDRGGDLTSSDSTLAPSGLEPIGCIAMQSEWVDVPGGAGANAPSLQLVRRRFASSPIAFGLRGDNLYSCESGAVQRFGLFDGEHEELPVPCEQVTVDEFGIVVTSASTIAEYEDVEALRESRPEVVFPNQGRVAMGLTPNFILSPARETDGVVQIDRRDGSVFDVVVFPQGVAEMLALDHVEDGRFVVVVRGAIEIYSAWGERMSRAPYGDPDGPDGGHGLHGIICGIEPFFETLETMSEINEPW